MEYDVIIVGGGPGGSTAASFCGKNGLKALLLEKATYPRDKTCGDAISGKSMKILKELGLTEEIEKNPHGKISGVIFSSPNGKVVQMPFKSQGRSNPGYCCRRLVYDNLVFQNSKKYATVEEGFTVTDVIIEGGFVKGVKGIDSKKQPREYRAKLVIGADGANSMVAKKMGLGEIDENHHCMALRAYYKGIKGLTENIELHFIDSILPGYFWIFPLEDGYANVGVGMVTSDMKKGKVDLKKAMFDALENHPLFKERFSDAKLEGEVKGWMLPFGSKHRKSAGNGFMLIGDAASLIDPFTGEGIGNAMTSGKMAAKYAKMALEANDVSENYLMQYDRDLWGTLGGELKTSYYLQKIGRITPLLNLVIGKASRSEHVRESLTAMLSNEESKKQLVSPLFYVRLLLA